MLLEKEEQIIELLVNGIEKMDRLLVQMEQTDKQIEQNLLKAQQNCLLIEQTSHATGIPTP